MGNIYNEQEYNIGFKGPEHCCVCGDPEHVTANWRGYLAIVVCEKCALDALPCLIGDAIEETTFEEAKGRVIERLEYSYNLVRETRERRRRKGAKEEANRKDHARCVEEITAMSDAGLTEDDVHHFLYLAEMMWTGGRSDMDPENFTLPVVARYLSWLRTHVVPKEWLKWVKEDSRSERWRGSTKRGLSQPLPGCYEGWQVERLAGRSGAGPDKAGPITPMHDPDGTLDRLREHVIVNREI